MTYHWAHERLPGSIKTLVKLVLRNAPPSKLMTASSRNMARHPLMARTASHRRQLASNILQPRAVTQQLPRQLPVPARVPEHDELGHVAVVPDDEPP